MESPGFFSIFFFPSLFSLLLRFSRSLNVRFPSALTLVYFFSFFQKIDIIAKNLGKNKDKKPILLFCLNNSLFFLLVLLPFFVVFAVCNVQTLAMKRRFSPPLNPPSLSLCLLSSSLFRLQFVCNFRT